MMNSPQSGAKGAFISRPEPLLPCKRKHIEGLASPVDKLEPRIRSCQATLPTLNATTYHPSTLLHHAHQQNYARDTESRHVASFSSLAHLKAAILRHRNDVTLHAYKYYTTLDEIINRANTRLELQALNTNRNVEQDERSFQRF